MRKVAILILALPDKSWDVKLKVGGIRGRRQAGSDWLLQGVARLYRQVQR